MTAPEYQGPPDPDRLWHLFRKSPALDAEVGAIDDEETRRAGERIRCPLCAWEPDASSRWGCVRTDVPEGFSGGCGTVWNTFSTRGRCPGCQHQWRWTHCLRCTEWSLHEDWYIEEP
jgi:hypothetical protein